MDGKLEKGRLEQIQHMGKKVSQWYEGDMSNSRRGERFSAHDGSCNDYAVQE